MRNSTDRHHDVIFSCMLFLLLCCLVIPSSLQADDKNLNVTKLKELLHKKHFQEIEASFINYQKNKVRTKGGGALDIALVQRIFEEEKQDNVELKELLNEWVAQSPKSEIPLIFRSQLYYVVAWKIRGHFPPSHTAEEKLQKFESLLNRSTKDAKLALEINPDSTLAIYRMLQILRSTAGNRDEFGKLFGKGTELDRDNLALYLEMLLMLNPAWGGDAEKMFHFARTTAKHASKEGPVSWILIEAHKDRARFDPMESYLRSDEIWEEIEKAAAPVFKNYPDTSHYVRTLGRMAWSAGRITRAKELMEEAARREPKNWELWYDLAKFFEQQLEERDSAIDYFTKAIALNKENPRLYQERGMIFYNGEDWKLAEKDFAKLRELTPKNPRVHYLHGRTLMKTSKMKEALEALNTSISLLGQDANKFALRARCEVHIEMKDFEKATKDCDDALYLEPTSEKVLALKKRIEKESKGAKSNQ